MVLRNALLLIFYIAIVIAAKRLTKRNKINEVEDFYFGNEVMYASILLLILSTIQMAAGISIKEISELISAADLRATQNHSAWRVIQNVFLITMFVYALAMQVTILEDIDNKYNDNPKAIAVGFCNLVSIAFYLFVVCYKIDLWILIIQ